MADQEQPEQFAVFAETKEHPKPLVLTHLSFGQLIDDVVMPYDKQETFFVDGVPVKPASLTRIKIVRQNASFDVMFVDLHYGMRTGNAQKSKTYGDQYHVRLEAAFRAARNDVTSQVLKAYKSEIKPKLSDYLPNREKLIDAAFKVFLHGMTVLTGG